MKSGLIGLWHEEQGQDLLEYALVLMLIVLVAVAAIGPLGKSIADTFADANACAEKQAAQHGHCAPR